MVMPTCIYALYEAGFRAFRGQSACENDKESARLYAEFAKIAAQPIVMESRQAWSEGRKDSHGNQAE